jgi:3-hydroxy acid dehydrogenase / malonic semialdehyde reductase
MNKTKTVKKNNQEKEPVKLLAAITGASSGIGMACAEKLAADGYSLILVARRLEVLKKLKTKLEADHKGCRVLIFKLDLADTRGVVRWQKENQKLLETVDVLVNNAGMARGTDKIQTAKWDDVEIMLDVNVKGLLAFALPIIKAMAGRKSGHVVNMGSVAGRWVYPGGAVYCATKFAVRALSEAMRQDLLGQNVRVTNIEPGMVNTEFSAVRLGNKNLADKVYENMTPLTGQDIAESISWCLRQPKHVNIQELVIYPTDQAHVGMVHRNI